MSIFRAFIGLERGDGPVLGGAFGNLIFLSCSALDLVKFSSLGLGFLCGMGDLKFSLFCRSTVALVVRSTLGGVCLGKNSCCSTNSTENDNRGVANRFPLIGQAEPEPYSVFQDGKIDIFPTRSLHPIPVLPASLLHPSNSAFQDALEHLLQAGGGCTLCSPTSPLLWHLFCRACLRRWMGLLQPSLAPQRWV